MVIKVNGELLDAVLENEKTAFEVVESVYKEFKSNEAIVSSIAVDGRFYSLEDKELKDILVASIQEISLEIATKEEVIVSLLEESKQMLKNISVDLRKNGYAHINEIGELFKWITETIQSINQLSVFDMVESKLMVSSIRQISEYLKSSDKDIDKIDSLASIIESLIKYLNAIELKITTNFTVSKEELKNAIAEAGAILPEISEAFQTGKDKEAFEKINTIIGVLELCCIHLKKNVKSFSESDQDEIEVLYEEINTLLTQVVEAFENGDVVLLGDLLEYELPEKLEKYRDIILKD
jgi:hypothetical protein